MVLISFRSSKTLVHLVEVVGYVIGIYMKVAPRLFIADQSELVSYLHTNQVNNIIIRREAAHSKRIQ